MNEPLVLTLGEVSGAPPEHVVRAVAASLITNTARYTPPAGLPAVRAAVAASLDVEAGNVVMTTGASGAYLAFLTRFGRPGGNILLPDPGYPAYAGLARRMGLQPRYYRLEDGLDDIDPDAVRALVDADTIAVVVVSPGNPTGHVIPHSVITAVAERSGVPMVVDEVYLDLTTHQGVDPEILWATHPDSVVFKSYSKSFSLSGLRIGALVAHSDRAAELASAHFAAVMSAPTTGQVAVLSCLDNDPHAYLDAVRARLRGRALAAHEVLGSVPGCEVASGDLGVFAWVRVGRSAEVADALWRRHRIAVSPGRPFGPSGEEYLRILIDVEPTALARVAGALQTEVDLVLQ